ncbi:hypothetical protein [Pseudodesulfovibrio tunisiensis]|uniref:hypothetical protein n=1 Tax=Pseudodesulfovibrio tunisiensis TaxID=463192 RepID=UPI001FB23100|nr:hypothetical protein [Pseudodesulfovibrio tunisiensis]
MDPTTLRSMAEDRPLSGPEIHPVNQFYGHAALLKQFLGLKPEYSLKVMLEHAPCVQEFIWDVEENSRLPILLCASERYAKYFNANNRGGKKAIPIGPYPAYLPRPQGQQDGTQRTLLLFPKHSTHHIQVEYDVEAYLCRIEDVAGQFDRVVACLYWKDILLGMDERYRRAGIELVTAGHMFDNGFLPRLLEIVSGADLVVSGHPGTDVSYSVLMGKPVMIIPNHDVMRYDDPQLEAEHRKSLTRTNEMQRIYPQVFNRPLDAPTPAQVELVEGFCGVRNVKSREALREIVVEAERLYCAKYGLEFTLPVFEESNSLPLPRSQAKETAHDQCR